MNSFYITVKNGNSIFGKFDKFEINLNTSVNIVKQADEITNSILDSFDILENAREDFSWKVFRNQGHGYEMVSKSGNWQGE